MAIFCPSPLVNNWPLSDLSLEWFSSKPDLSSVSETPQHIQGTQRDEIFLSVISVNLSLIDRPCSSDGHGDFLAVSVNRFLHQYFACKSQLLQLSSCCPSVSLLPGSLLAFPRGG